MYVSIIKGIEVALDNPIDVRLPDDSNLTISIASLPAFFATKAVALERREQRNEAKDAYDIVYCLRNYPGGVHEIAKEFQSAISSPIVAAGVDLLRELFATTGSIGPVAYARGSEDLEDAALKRREAFERVAELLERIRR